MQRPPTGKMEYEKSEYLIYPEELMHSGALCPPLGEARLILSFGKILSFDKGSPKRSQNRYLDLNAIRIPVQTSFHTDSPSRAAWPLLSWQLLSIRSFSVSPHVQQFLYITIIRRLIMPYGTLSLCSTDNDKAVSTISPVTRMFSSRMSLFPGQYRTPDPCHLAQNVCRLLTKFSLSVLIM